MSASWDPNLSTKRDNLRLTLGDTGKIGGEFLFENETYDALLSQYSYNQALGKASRALASQFAQEPSWYKAEDGVDVRWEKRVDQWNMIADRYDPIAQSDPTPTAANVFIAAPMVPLSSQFGQGLRF